MDTKIELKCPKCNCDVMYKIENVGYTCVRCGYCPNKNTYLKANYSHIENSNSDSIPFIEHDSIIE